MKWHILFGKWGANITSIARTGVPDVWCSECLWFGTMWGVLESIKRTVTKLAQEIPKAGAIFLGAVLSMTAETCGDENNTSSSTWSFCVDTSQSELQCLSSAAKWIQLCTGHTAVQCRDIFIDREAREIIRLVASVRLSVRPSADALTSEPFSPLKFTHLTEFECNVYMVLQLMRWRSRSIMVPWLCQVQQKVPWNTKS